MASASSVTVQSFPPQGFLPLSRGRYPVWPGEGPLGLGDDPRVGIEQQALAHLEDVDPYIEVGETAGVALDLFKSSSPHPCTVRPLLSLWSWTHMQTASIEG